VGRWLLLASTVAALAGSASAIFLLALEWATATRESHRWLIWGLPLAGFVVGWVYLKLGRDVEGGNNLLIDEVHDPKSVVPLRMAPLILASTVISHLFGASVEREGTAVQMGGALADQITHVFEMKPEDRRILLMAGISAGFASVSVGSWPAHGSELLPPWQLSVCAECCTAEFEKSTTWNSTGGLPLYFLFLQCCTFPGVSH